MQNPRRTTLAAVMASVALVSSACETTSLVPEPPAGPAPVTVRAGWPGAGADYGALLQALHAGQAIDPRQEEAVHMLAGTLARMKAFHDSRAGGNSRLSPSAEYALREFMASPGGAAMQDALERLAAGYSTPEARP